MIFMYGFNFIIRDEMRISLFLDDNDRFFHFNKGSWNYDLVIEEVDLLIVFGRENIKKLVKSMKVYETKQLSDHVKLNRFR